MVVDPVACFLQSVTWNSCFTAAEIPADILSHTRFLSMLLHSPSLNAYFLMKSFEGLFVIVNHIFSTKSPYISRIINMKLIFKMKYINLQIQNKLPNVYLKINEDTLQIHFEILLFL